MNFKKYIISMIICAVTIFTMIFNMFVPIKSYAIISYEQEVLNYWTSVGANQGIPYTPSYFQQYTGWNNFVPSYNSFVEGINTINYPNKIYVTRVFTNNYGPVIYFEIFFYDYIKSYTGPGNYITFNSYSYCLYSSSFNEYGLQIVSFAGNLSPSGNSRFIYPNLTSNAFEYYIQFSGSSFLTPDDSQNNILSNILGKIKGFGNWLLNGIRDLDDMIVLNTPYGKFFNDLKDNANRYIKNILNTTDDNDVSNVLTGYINGNLKDINLSNGNHLTDNQITYISNTLGNLQDVYSKNIDIQYNTEDNKYYITPSTSYDTYTSEQITDYFNNYIAYNYNNSYTTYLSIDLSTIETLLGQINANIINCHMTLNSVNSSINSLGGVFAGALTGIFLDFETDLKGIFSDFIIDLDTTINSGDNSSNSVDLTSITDILTNISTDINGLAVAFADFDFDVIVGGFADIDANFNALGGVIAGAIGVAWADIKSDLQLMIDSINLNFGDITIGDSSTSDDDTTNKIKFDFDSLVDKINLNFKDLFDDLKINIKDLFDDIHVTVKPDTDEPSNPDNDTSQDYDDDFWKAVKSIVIRKIPLYSQCVDLLSPVTTVTYNQLTSSDGYLLGDGTITINENFNNISNDDLFSTYDKQVFNGLAVVVFNVSDNIVGVKIPINLGVYGVENTCYVFDTTPYTGSRYKDIVSNIILAICYLGFAWRIINRVSGLFGRNRVVGKEE